MRAFSHSTISSLLVASLVSIVGCSMSPAEGEPSVGEDVSEDVGEEVGESSLALMDGQLSKDGIWVSGSASGVQRVATAVAATASGGFVVGATQTQTNGNKGMTVVRFKSDATVDPAWNHSSFSAVNFKGTLNAVAVDSSNRVLAAGWDNATGNDSHFLVARYTSGGVLDTTFGTPNAQGVRTGLAYLDLPGTGEVAYSITPWRSGYVVGGAVSNSAGQKSFAILRLKSDGTLDTTFSQDGKVVLALGASAEIRNVFVVPGATAASDRLIVTGPAKQTAVDGARDGIGLAAFTNTGALDTSAWSGGTRLHAPSGMKLVPTSAALSKDGKRLYVVGQGKPSTSTNEIAFSAKISSGELDSTFDLDGVSFHDAPSTTTDRATGVSLDRRERLVISGTGTGNGTTGTNKSAWLQRVSNDSGKADDTFYAGKFHKIDAPNSSDGTNESLLAVVANSGGYTTAVGQISDTTSLLEALVVRMLDEPHATNFDPSGITNPPWINSYLLARISNVAYYDAEATAERPKTLSRLGFTQRAYVETEANGAELQTPALVVESSNVVVVAFMGTVPDFNLESDADFDQIPYRGALTHKGFTTAMLKAWPVVLPHVKASLAAMRSRKVWVTGHSLGAAVATLFGYELEFEGIDTTGVVTFGSPRIGDATFKSLYNARLGSVTHRFVNHGDWVPSVPFTSMESGYAHVGRQHFINYAPADLTDPEDCTGAPSDSRLCTKGVLFDLVPDQEYTPKDLLDDHKIAGYGNYLIYMMPTCTRIGIACQ